MPKIEVDIPRETVNSTTDCTTITNRTVRHTLIEIYLEQGYSLNKISKLLKCSKHTIIEVKRGKKIGSKLLATRLKEQLADKFTVHASMFLDYANQQDKLDKASTLQLVTAAGISVDKARLLNNESTMNVNVRDVHSDVKAKLEQVERLIEAGE